MRRRWVTAALVVALVALVATAGFLGRHGGFEGTDAQVSQALEGQGYRAWFAPVFSPSGEVESGLFALQAGLGGVLLGYCLGRLHAARRASTPTPSAPVGPVEGGRR